MYHWLQLAGWYFASHFGFDHRELASSPTWQAFISDLLLSPSIYNLSFSHDTYFDSLRLQCDVKTLVQFEAVTHLFCSLAKAVEVNKESGGWGVSDGNYFITCFHLFSCHMDYLKWYLELNHVMISSPFICLKGAICIEMLNNGALGLEDRLAVIPKWRVGNETQKSI